MSSTKSINQSSSRAKPSSADLTLLVRIAREAGYEVMKVYGREFLVEIKDDNSPLTEADLIADRLISKELQAHFPDITIVTEECTAGHQLADPSARFFLVDPIDGTKEFVKRTGEFTINIALIENNKPIAGVVYAPALGRLFAGIVGGEVFEEDENGARKSLMCRAFNADDIAAVASVSHLTEQSKIFMEANNITKCVTSGSSLKFCVLAAGEADIYPRHSPTMEWDTAAGDAVLSAAGGHILTSEGAPLKYGKAGFKNPFFIASSAQAKYIHP